MANRMNSTRVGRNNAVEEFSGAEEYLYATLMPVKPRPEFVKGLGGRLKGPLPPIKTSLRALQSVILLTAGIISSLVILITGVRVLVLLMDRVRVMR
jgi:hypothetical protein